MPVKIKEIAHFELLVVFYLLDESLKLADLRDQLLIFGSEHAIQIFTRQTSPIVAKNDSIRVEHRNNLEDHMLSHFPSFLREDIPEKPFHHIACI